MSATPPSNSHDAYFRHVLGRPTDAASELRAVLPEAVAARVDWEGLELQSGSFVSKQLRSRYSDLLFRTRLDGYTAYIYLLIEHQSRSDPLMPFRMLDYLVSIWNHYLREHPDTRTLPAVVPLVVHSNHTGRRWTAPTELAELIDLDPPAREALGPHLPRFRFLLDDVAALDLPALRARDLTPPPA
ncbi:Rpn family recombination-promoting nuclease/putative transposase [Nocardia sp. NPDC050793]|uniref:Rpn family recombination-promoting nuclease/putative transposase n=1 Tax=Nocardia sp. NPDC050793 TaxID=3155159 RepID=UPI0033E29981